MNIDEFSFLFFKLAKSFSVSKIEDKCAAYFEYFSNKNLKTLESAVEHWVKKKPKFPSVAELLEAYEIFTPNNEFQGCGVCNGSGWVYPRDENFGVRRGNCEHGMRLAEYAGPVYIGETRHKISSTMTEDEKSYAWACDIMKDPVMFMKGYKFIAPILFRQNKPLFDKVAMIARECLGEERFGKMFTNFKTFDQLTKIPVKNNY